MRFVGWTRVPLPPYSGCQFWRLIRLCCLLLKKLEQEPEQRKMQPRHRNTRDGFRQRPAFGRNRSRGGLSRSYSKPHNPLACKLDILMEAGRLAAEYLVSKGVLSASSLPRNAQPKGSFQEFRGQSRENPSPPSYNPGRTSALDRLGEPASDAGYKRKRFDDGYDRVCSKKNGRGRKRSGFHDRGYSGPDWGKERGRNGPWTERSRGYSDSVVEEDGDCAPGQHRDRYEEVGSSISRCAADEQHSKAELVGESGSELDDAGSKASSNSTRKDVIAEGDDDENKGADAVKVVNWEAVEDKSSKGDDLGKKKAIEEDFNLMPDRVQEGGIVSNDSNDLLKLCCFPNVPTRPRSILAHRVPTVDCFLRTDGGNRVEVVSGGETDLAVDKVPTDRSLKDLNVVHADNLKCEDPADVDDFDAKSLKESIEHDPQQSLPSFPCTETSIRMIDDVTKGEKFGNNIGQEEERQKQISSSLPTASQENELCQLSGARKTPSIQFLKMPSQSDEIMESVEQLKPINANLVPKVEDESFKGIEEAKQNQSTSFKICDLNLTEAPEITEMTDDPMLDDCKISAPSVETEKQLLVDFGLSINSKAIVTYDFNRLSGDEKVIPVIDLEDDSSTEVNACDASKTKNEIMYPVENVLNHTENSDDLPVIQDSYSIAISDYLGTDISPSAQEDLSNLQVGMGLHGVEGFPGVDDAIYGSLGDIGFIEVWDQQAQDYEKFF